MNQQNCLLPGNKRISARNIFKANGKFHEQETNFKQCNVKSYFLRNRWAMFISQLLSEWISKTKITSPLDIAWTSSPYSHLEFKIGLQYFSHTSHQPEFVYDDPDKILNCFSQKKETSRDTCIQLLQTTLRRTEIEYFHTIHVTFRFRIYQIEK